MRRRKWSKWFFPLAAAALVIYITAIITPDNDEPQRPAADPPSPQTEHRMKALRVQGDVEATAMLCKAECASEMKLLLTKSDDSDKQRRQMIRSIMKKHPHMLFFAWIYNGSRTEYGEIPHDLKASAKHHIRKAADVIAQKRSYDSGPLEENGHRYMIISVPGRNSNGDGIIGLIKQDILSDVERHQKRNLRLVPFPSEGRFRTESVRPETMSDMTVRTGEQNGNASHYYTNEVVVKFRHDPGEADINKIKKAIDAEDTRKLDHTFVFRSKSMNTVKLMDYFKANWQPLYAEPHYLYLTNSEKFETSTAMDPIIPNDTFYSDYQWNLPSINTERGWNVSKGDEGVVVAVLDTGVQTDHPDLSGQLVEGTNIVDTTKPPSDDVGHGTHVAGIISAAVNNGEGVAGVSWFNKIMPVKVLDGTGAGTTYSVAQGIIWATDHGAKVINMSLGNYASAQFLHDAVRYAYERDVVLIAASGNDNTDRPGYPAAYPEVFAVGATDSSGEKASFSNYGDYIDVAAPGASIASTYTENQYAALSGTSMASPHAAALAALIRSKNPDLTNVEVMEIMRNTADDLGTPGKDDYFGFGQINVVSALESATQMSNAQYPFTRRLFRFADIFR